MLPDEGEFFSGETAGLLQNGVGDTDLADVVQERANPDILESSPAHPSLGQWRTKGR